VESKAEWPDVDVSKRIEKNGNAGKELMAIQQVPRDDALDGWIGEWFIPIRGRYYIVPPNSINHKSEAGRIGKCIGIRTSGFHMSWALLEYIPETDKETKKWVRTKFIVEVEDNDVPEEFTVDQIRGPLSQT
jgi:hypothetical protein